MNEVSRRGYRERVYESYVSAFKGREDAAALEAAFTRHARFLDHLLGPMLSALRPRKVLDAGCGQGRLLFWAVAREIGDVRGFDLSAEQVAVARGLGLNAEVSSADDYFARCDRDFDLIVAMDLIEHFTRDEALTFLEHCHDSLRPGGILFITTPNGTAWRPGPVVYGDLTHETIFSPETICLALRLSRFSDASVAEVTPAPTTMGSRARYALWRLLRLAPAVLDIVEKGTQATHVYSRVMAVRATRSPR